MMRVFRNSHRPRNNPYSILRGLAASKDRRQLLRRSVGDSKGQQVGGMKRMARYALSVRCRDGPPAMPAANRTISAPPSMTTETGKSTLQPNWICEVRPIHINAVTGAPMTSVDGSKEIDAMKTYALMFSTMTLMALAGGPAMAQQITGTPGSPSATTTIDGNQLPAPPPKFGGVIKENRQGFEDLVAAARRAAQGRAQRSAHHDRRPGLWRQRHVRRRHPDAGAGPDREGGAALHASSTPPRCARPRGRR